MMSKFCEFLDVDPSILSCSICLDGFKVNKKIYQCSQGHLICDSCYHQLRRGHGESRQERCPTCRTPWESRDIRCRILEELLQKLHYPNYCLNRVHGCPERLDDTRYHNQIDCHYQQISCHFKHYEKCNEKVSLINYSNHLLTSHRHQVKLSNNNNLTISDVTFKIVKKYGEDFLVGIWIYPPVTSSNNAPTRSRDREESRLYTWIYLVSSTKSHNFRYSLRIRMQVKHHDNKLGNLITHNDSVVSPINSPNEIIESRRALLIPPNKKLTYFSFEIFKD